MKKVLLALLLTAFPTQGWAAGCGCGSISAMLTATKTQTIQAVNAYTAAEAQAIRSEILLAAQNIIGTLKAESATIVRALVALKESNAASIKGQAVAGEAMKTEDMYGKAAQPAGLCGTSALGAGIQLGAQAGQEVHATMREKQLAYANTAGVKPVEFLNRVLAEDHPTEKETLDALFPLQDTLTEDQVAQAHESVKTLANPRPLPVLTDEQKKQAEMEERRDMVLPEGMSRPVVVFTAKNRLEAESIEDMLRDNDIPVFDRPAAFRQIQSYSGADARFGVELVVDASQTARARQLIDEMQTELSENELSEDDLARLAEEQAEQMPKAEVEDSASLRLLPVIAGILVLALVVLYFVTR